jgi:hypothetical protein
MIWTAKAVAGQVKRDARKINTINKIEGTVLFDEEQTGAEGTGKGGQNKRRFGSNAYDENKGDKK